MQNKLTARPSHNKSLETFVMEADKKKNSFELQETKSESYPWLSENVRSDVTKSLTVQLKEEYLLKIKFLSMKTNISQQKMLREFISKGVEQMLNDIIKVN